MGTYIDIVCSALRGGRAQVLQGEALDGRHARPETFPQFAPILDRGMRYVRIALEEKGQRAVQVRRLDDRIRAILAFDDGFPLSFSDGFQLRGVFLLLRQGIGSPRGILDGEVIGLTGMRLEDDDLVTWMVMGPAVPRSGCGTDMSGIQRSLEALRRANDKWIAEEIRLTNHSHLGSWNGQPHDLCLQGDEALAMLSDDDLERFSLRARRLG